MPTFRSKSALAIVFTLVLTSVFCTFSFAQQIGPPKSVVLNGDINTPTLVQDPNERFEEQQIIMKNNHPDERPNYAAEIACFLPPLAGIHVSTVGVDALAAQAKASAEYGKACDAIFEKKFDAAEKHLRKALEKYPEYSALWVLLGQVQERHEQFSPARESCLRAAKINSTFVPAHLCLADVAIHAQDWNEVLKESDLALALDPSSSAVSYMFNAGANFNLRHFLAAEKSALRAAQFAGAYIDARQVHYLLAEIYEAKGDLVNEMAQLREFVKVAGDGKDAQVVKQYLAKLSATPQKPQPTIK